jgi:hypothetical protein
MKCKKSDKHLHVLSRSRSTIPTGIGSSLTQK